MTRNDDEQGNDDARAAIGRRTLTTAGLALLLVGSLLVAAVPSMAQTSDGIDRAPEVAQTREGLVSVAVDGSCADEPEACEDPGTTIEVEVANAQAEVTVNTSGASAQAAAGPDSETPCWLFPHPYDWLCKHLTGQAGAYVSDACGAADRSTIGLSNETTGETQWEPTVSCQDGEVSIVVPPFPPHCPYAPPCDWDELGLPSV